MTRLIFISIFLVLLIAAFVFIKPALIFITTKILERQIPGSSASIEKCDLNLHQISFWNVKIHNPDVFDFNVQEVIARYSLLSLLAQNIPVIVMNDAAFYYKKVKIENIQALGWLKGQKYYATVHFANVAMGDVLDSFKLNDKLAWDGIMHGDLNISGEGRQMKIINGNLLSENKGGTIVIKDTQFLQNVAQNSKLPANLVVDSFQNYHYDSGSLKLYLEQEVLILDVALNGQTGKRNLKINLHDFTMK